MALYLKIKFLDIIKIHLIYLKYNETSNKGIICLPKIIILKE